MKANPAAKQSDPVAVRLPKALQEKLQKGCEKTGLNKSAMLRVAANRGLDLIIESLTGESKTAA